LTSCRTLLEIAQRHVADSEVRVAHQSALVSGLAQQGRNTAQAEILLAAFKETLRLMREVLAREQQRAARRR
jgi:hypothetical protein